MKETIVNHCSFFFKRNYSLLLYNQILLVLNVFFACIKFNSNQLLLKMNFHRDYNSKNLVKIQTERSKA
jgi:hypothetical protein